MTGKSKVLYITGAKGVIDETKQSLIGVVGSTGVIDRQGESVNPMGWQLNNFIKNPVIMYGHNYSSLPIGKADRVYIESGKLMFDITFAETEMGKEVFNLFKGGFLSAFSVGFIPKKWGISGQDEYDIMEQELLELSAVPVPANPEALSYLKENAPNICKTLFNEDGTLKAKKKKLKKVAKKDVSETVEIAYLVGNLNWLIEAFKQNNVSEEATNKMAEAMVILLDVLKMEAEVGKKAFEVGLKSGRTLSKKNEDAIKTAVESLSAVLASLEEQKEVEKPAEEIPPIETPAEVVPPVETVETPEEKPADENLPEKNNEETSKLLTEIANGYKKPNVNDIDFLLKDFKCQLGKELPDIK